jgi:superfamily II DNA or RNA helicase
MTLNLNQSMSKTQIVILDNKQCQISSDDEKLLKSLHSYLSFKLTGIEYTPAYKNGWSGITYLLSKNGKFNYGLLNKVKIFLDKKGLTYQVQDNRSPKISQPELDISENLVQHNLVPREHQLRVCQTACQVDRGIIRVATGGGKSLMTAMITAKLNKPTIIYVIGLDLLDQFHKLYSKLFQEPIGYIGNGICQIERINIASIWTIGRALKIGQKDIITDDNEAEEKELDESNFIKIINLLHKTQVHIFDESHVVTTSTITEIYKNIDPEYIYGFSGTPFRDDNSDLQIHGILGEQIINVSASELIKINLLAAPLIKFYTVPKMSAPGPNYPAVYKSYIVENNARNRMIVEISQQLIDKKYTPLVLFKQIKHGEILLNLLQEAGIKCAMLYGNDSLDKRNEIKEQLIKQDIQLILASTIFDIGLDLPELNALLLAGSGKSNIRSLQRIGRVIRMIPGKKFAAVADFYDQVKFLRKHSMTRYKIYSSEDGFKVIKSKEMK